MTTLQNVFATAAAILVTCASGPANTVDEVIASLQKTPSDREILASLARASVAEMDEETKARGLAICHLGFLLLRQPEMAERAKEILLRDCAMSEYATVVAASPFITDSECAACKGKGVNTATCPDCNGVIPASYLWRSRHVVQPATGRSRSATACTSCQGAGDRPGVGSGRLPCFKCRGQRICQTCSGLGQIQTPCTTCTNGQTSALDIEAARTLYLQWLNKGRAPQPATPAP